MSLPDGGLLFFSCNFISRGREPAKNRFTYCKYRTTSAPYCQNLAAALEDDKQKIAFLRNPKGTFLKNRRNRCLKSRSAVRPSVPPCVSFYFFMRRGVVCLGGGGGKNSGPSLVNNKEEERRETAK